MWVSKRRWQALEAETTRLRGRVEALLEEVGDLKAAEARLKASYEAAVLDFSRMQAAPEPILGAMGPGSDPFAIDEAELARIRKEMLAAPVETLWNEGGAAVQTAPTG